MDHNEMFQQLREQIKKDFEMQTVTEITETDVMHREINRGLMVQYINAQLLSRADLDVRTSYVFYDEDKLFNQLALNYIPNEEVLQKLYDKTAIRYWSKGIV